MLKDSDIVAILPAENMDRAWRFYEDGIADLGSELAAWFKDSQGNTIGVFQPTPGDNA